MSVHFMKARNFIYSNGTLWERALFAYLFEDGPVERVHQCLLCYRNPDNGYGHALEHDIRYPGSHPLALEFLLRILQDMELPPGPLLDGVAEWVEANQQDDGFLKKPPELLEYPHAPWWNNGGQDQPDSIVGNLIAMGKASDSMMTKTRQWVQTHRTLEHIRNEEWLFMMYHAYDYFMHDEDFPDVETFRQATVERIVQLAGFVDENQYYSLFIFATSPESRVAKAAPKLIQKALDVLETQQQEDGSWHDQHELSQWYPYWTILNLLTLRRFGRLPDGT